MASSLLFFSLLLFHLQVSMADNNIACEDGYTISTVIDGNGFHINPRSILSQFGSSGLLTDLRSASVNNDCYAQSAVKFGLHKHILHASQSLHKDIVATVQNFEQLLLETTFGWESETTFPKGPNGCVSLGRSPSLQCSISKAGAGLCKLDRTYLSRPSKLKSASDEERMLILYFNRIGWPTSLPTSEKGSFMKSVLREKMHGVWYCKNALDDLLISKSLPLRPGIEDFVDDAYNEGIPVVILTAYSKSGDKIARSIVDKLGNDRISKIKLVGNEEVERSFYGQLVLGKGASSSMDEQLAQEARKAASAEKQRIAEEVALMLKLSVEIDTSSTDSLPKIVAALRAGAEYAGVPVYNCVLVAGSQSGVSGAERISMPCIVLRSRHG
ncbi:hypothetical protein ACSBR1_014074 [Camellia fascicularis]